MSDSTTAPLKPGETTGTQVDTHPEAQVIYAGRPSLPRPCLTHTVDWFPPASDARSTFGPTFRHQNILAGELQ
jgi:hypothetical protein